MVKLIRYAAEGFSGNIYLKGDPNTPKFVNKERNDEEGLVIGCYVFIEEIDEGALSYQDEEGNWVNRLQEKRHELWVPDETLIWTVNRWPVVKNGELAWEFQYSVIFEDPLLNWSSWIQMPASKILERVTLVQSFRGHAGYVWTEGILDIRHIAEVGGQEN